MKWTLSCIEKNPNTPNEVSIRLGFWARVLAFLFRALPLVVRVDAKHETHIQRQVQRTPVESGISAALFRSLCLHSRHTNILHTSPPPPSSHKHHGGQAARPATAREAKRPNCQGQGPSTPQALHLHIADMLADGRVRAFLVRRVA